MKTVQPVHQRKLRQLKYLVRCLRRTLYKTCAWVEIDKLFLRIKKLIVELRNRVAEWQIKKVIGHTALLAGISFASSGSSQNFAPVQQNPFGLARVSYNSTPAFADLDNDGDLDLLVGEFYKNFWYFQNTGTPTSPSFTTAPQKNPFGITQVYYWAAPAFADLDNDGDMDMMSGEQYGWLQYFKNTGSATVPAFAAQYWGNYMGFSTLNKRVYPAFGDLDADGDKDAMAGDCSGNFQYFANVGTATAASFTALVQNPYGLTAAATGTAAVSTPSFIDMDGDGDLDLISTDDIGNFKYFENTGTSTSPAFAPVLTNPFNLTAVNGYASITFGDLDGDGDKDMIAGDYYGNLNYFERTPPLGIKNAGQISETALTIYPNPAIESIKIIGAWSSYITKVEIIDVQGKICSSYSDIAGKSIAVKELSPGLYTVKITHENGSFEVKKLNKE